MENTASIGSRFMPLLEVLVASVAFLLLVGFGKLVVSWLLPSYATGDVRARTTMLLTGAVLGEALSILLLFVYLRWQGSSLSELGLTQLSPNHAWIVAIVLTSLFCWLMLAGPLRGKAPVFEVSGFHIYNSLIAGLGAGICEEIIFRGFVMTELNNVGYGRVVQVLASGLLFGLAHFRFGSVGGEFSLRTSVGAIIPTVVMGMLYAGVYLLSRRSLLPVIASHTITDMVIEPWLVLAMLSGTMRQT